MRVKNVEGADERIVGEKAGILLVKEQGKSVGLVPVSAMVTAKGQE